MLKDSTIDDLSKLGYENSTRNEESKTLGCFFCLAVFPSTDIETSRRIYDEKDKTDICPHCSVDSVISIDKLLGEMNKRMF